MKDAVFHTKVEVSNAAPQPTPSPERAKFVALAQKRMNRAIKAIREVGKLDRCKGYSDNDADDIADALIVEADWVRKRLRLAAEGGPDFRLDAQGEG